MILPRTRATQRPAYGEAGICSSAVTGFFSSVISGRWFIFFQIHNANEGQVSIILIEIETIAEDEIVWNLEPAIMNRHHGFASFCFVEQSADLKTARLTDL